MFKILIVKRDKLGDLLLTVPLIELLAENFPTARIDVWGTAFTTFLVDSHPSISHVWPLRKRLDKGISGLVQAWEIVAQLIRIRTESYDWVVVASGEASPRAIRRARLAGGARLVSFVPNDSVTWGRLYSAVTHKVAMLQPTAHESVRLAKLAEPIVGRPVSTPNVPFPSLYLSPQVRSMGLRYIETQNLKPRCFVVLGLGARKEKRRPTVRQILAWSRYLSDRGYKCVLSYTPAQAADPGYPSDDTIAQEILSQCRFVHALCGSIEEAVAVVSFAAFSVFPDSGLMHIAAASDGGVIGLFADPYNSPSPEQWGPRGVRSKVIIAQKHIAEMSDAVVFEAFDNFIQRCDPI